MNSILERLRSIQKKHRLPHGLLFAGPSGSGKKLTALSLTQDLFCETNKESAGCGNCTSCRKITSGHHPDLYVVQNEAREIKIEQVRELQKWLFIAPYEATRKVGIIEDADLLNQSSSNALLKTLEEPPPHGLLILLTRSTANLLPTIRSRMMMVHFPPSNQDHPLSGLEKPDWVETLENLLSKKIPYDPETIFSLSETIAKNRELLPWFFETVERTLRDELFLTSTNLPSHSDKLERLFDLAIQTEKETMQRYGNVALGLDHFLLQYLT